MDYLDLMTMITNPLMHHHETYISYARYTDNSDLEDIH